jgi:hypothetical protein
MDLRVDIEWEFPLTRSTFARGRERLVMDRVAAAAIVITVDGGPPQMLPFAGPLDAMFFESQMETELLRTRWTLARFESRRASGQQLSGHLRPDAPLVPTTDRS